MEAPFYESTDRNAENAEIDLLVCIFYIFVRAMLTRTYFVASWVQFPWSILEYLCRSTPVQFQSRLTSPRFKIDVL